MKGRSDHKVAEINGPTTDYISVVRPVGKQHLAMHLMQLSQSCENSDKQHEMLANRVQSSISILHCGHEQSFVP